jgi:Met-zincin/Domain of unknown function (DUF5117)/Domain of unknown function (DUF5118)
MTPFVIRTVTRTLRLFHTRVQPILNLKPRVWAFVLGVLLTLLPIALHLLIPAQGAIAQTAQKNTPQKNSKLAKPTKPGETATGSDPTGKGKPGKKSPLDVLMGGEPQPPFELVTKNTKKTEGLFTLYRNDKSGKLYLELFPEQLNRNYMTTMTLESAIGQRGLYSGVPVGEFLFNFRRVNNTVQLVIPNTYVRAEPGSPIARTVARSFSDSPIETMKVITTREDKKSVLVELNSTFLGDLPGLKPVVSEILGGLYNIDPNRTYFGTLKNFPKNVEIESVYGYAGGESGEGGLPSFLSALPDNRAFEMKVRYSLSAIPGKNGYRPRLADDRIGYFLTAFRSFGRESVRQPFVRYINRWHLEKADPLLPLSPPVKPITYWLENTIPLEYRDALRNGILMWNEAYEKIGFKNAIEVKQMPDNADWDPADVRYNTIRWFTSTDAAFAMGPSRVNPLTGEILDADIIIDANFIRSLKQEFRSLIEINQDRNQPFIGALMGDRNLCQDTPTITKDFKKIKPKPVMPLRFGNHGLNLQDLCYGMGGMQQFATGQMTLSVLQNALPSDQSQKDYINEFLSELVAHEVGHTLGLRHNFQASTMLKPEELNNTEITRKKGLAASVMDYNAVNLAPQGTKQGDYYTKKIGPYDEWAIAYGYSTFTDPQAERDFLSKLASRSSEPDLAYSTDEDVAPGLNPKVQRFDMSGDLLTYSQWQFDNARAMWSRLDQRLPLQGESFNDLRIAFNGVFSYYFGYATKLTDYIGGQYFNRSRFGDAAGRIPFESVSLADQRKALDLIRRNVFDEKAFQFSPDLLNKLAPSRWNHWGTLPSSFKLDYPVLDRLLFLQTLTLVQLTDYDRLTRLSEGELKNPAQTLTVPELFDSLQSSIWSELFKGDDTVKISTVRRGLQRQHMNLLIAIALRQYDAPEDAQTVVRYEMKQLRNSLNSAIKKVDSKDIYTLAHLEETRDRLSKAIDAPLVGR